MQLALADALHRSGKNRDAKQVLASLGSVSGELNAQRLYLLGQVALAANDNDTFYRTVDELRQADPASPWLEQALLSAANLHLVHHEYDQALDAFREAQQRFPNGPRASYVHWKAAWLTLAPGPQRGCQESLRGTDRALSFRRGNSCGSLLARSSGRGRQPARHGAGVLPETFGSLSQLLLCGVGQAEVEAPPSGRRYDGTNMHCSIASLRSTAAAK